jgi:hypothetical protein
MSARPQNIGIKAIELYFPNQVRNEIAQGGICEADALNCAIMLTISW